MVHTGHSLPDHPARPAETSGPWVFVVLVTSLLAAVVLALGGCATAGAPPAAAAGQPAARPLPDFSSARRCMDTLLLDYGTRDLTVVVENTKGETGARAGGDDGVRELLTASISDMTQRSRAIRVVAPGDTPASALGAAPQYALRGVVNRSDPKVLGLDLTLLATQDSSVVPGTASRNSAALYDGSAELRKFGLRYSIATRPGDGAALRAVVDVASIELFGRLAKVPYWNCLGVSNTEANVQAEIQDWYDAMATRPAELIGYFQLQLRTRHVYDGPLDGTVNAPFKDAVARYRAALGLAREPKLSLDFFQAYLSNDARAVAARVPPPAEAPAPAVASAVSPGGTSTAAPLPAPLALRIASATDARRFAPGDTVQLTILPTRDAYVYCYLQDENRRIARFFPNRFQRDSRVGPAAGIQLPGAMRFQIVVTPRGAAQTVACFATDRDVLPQLPDAINAGDFDPVAVATLDQLRGAFAKVANGGAFAQEQFAIRSK